MDALNHRFVRKWLSFGTGAGIVIGREDLEVMVVNIRPQGVRVLAETRIERFRERPAAEWGDEYARFLASMNTSHLAAMAVLPREEVILRTLHLPGVADADTEAAVRFQMEGMHPFPDEQVMTSWQRLNGSSTVAVAIVERTTLDFYITLFAEAGVKLAGLTVSSAVMRAGVRMLAQPPEQGFVGVFGMEAREEPPFDIYGESPARPMFSASFEVARERAVGLAASELRLDPATEPVDWIQMLPTPVGGPEGFDLSPASRSLGAARYAAAVTAACPHLGSPVNLLPAELRAGTSRARYIPSIVLASILALLGLTLIFQGRFEDRRYLGLLNAEIRKLDPAARKLEASDKQIAEAQRRIESLDSYRRRPADDLDALLELTNLIPAPGWATNIAITGQTVNIAGEADQAEGLLKVLDKSPYFEGSELAMPITKMGNLELFRIRSQREKGAHK